MGGGRKIFDIKILFTSLPETYFTSGVSYRHEHKNVGKLCLFPHKHEKTSYLVFRPPDFIHTNFTPLALTLPILAYALMLHLP